MPPNSVKLIWPLVSSDSSQWSYHAVSMHMDHDEKIGSVKDYNCNDQSYDLLDGYNHRGTDIMLWPFSWNMMDENIINVVAATDGIIIHKMDGNYDRNCSIDSKDNISNSISLLHKDGSISLYYHLKINSVTKKNIGEKVEKGEVIGLVGSSGHSTGPHLHFELYDSQNKVVDPFGGPCSGRSWWEDQKPYFDTAINHIYSHESIPQLPHCPEPEIIYESDHFFQGDTVYLSSYFRDLLPNEPSLHKVLTPSGKEFKSFDFKTDIFFKVYPTLTFINIPKNGETGEWTYSINFLRKNYSWKFYVNQGPRPIKEKPKKPTKREQITLTLAQPKSARDYTCQNNNQVYFSHDSDELNKYTIFVLNRIVKYLQENGMNDVKVTGFTSSVGSKKYNLNLSMRRSFNVAKYFEENGIETVQSFGKGENKIIRDQWGREIEDKSRRVEICYRR